MTRRFSAPLTAALGACAAVFAFAAPANAAEPAAFVATATAVQGDADAGKAAFGMCGACHTADKGGARRVGPNLWGVYGAEAASKEGFTYSPALANSGITWDDATLDAFLANPNAVVPGNRMPFLMPDAAKRADVIAYLKTLQD